MPLKPENKGKLIAVLSYHVVPRNLKTFALIEKLRIWSPSAAACFAPQEPWR